jgi:epoxyqueuosine reductase QueG
VKKCSTCGETKPLDEFYLQSTNPSHRAYGRPQGRCKKCVRSQVQRYRQENAAELVERQRVYRLRHYYGIEADEYDSMLARQGGGCAICGAAPPWNRGLRVDHDHATGAVRGLLCNECNRGIGLLQDDPRLLDALVAYLEAAPQ